MTGIYGGDGEQLSLRATFPNLRALELEHGSVIRGLERSRQGASRYPPFVALRAGGCKPLLQACSSASGRRSSSPDAPRVGARRARPEVGGGEAADGRPASSGRAAPREAPCGPRSRRGGAAHGSVPPRRSSPSRIDEDSLTLDGYGYVVPRVEGSDVLACTWTSSKWEGRAPAGGVLVRVYAGRFGGRDVTEDSDEELVALARDEVRLVGIEAGRRLARVHRWPLGMPQYVLGHPERLDRIDCPRRSPRFAGAAYRGVGSVPDCIHSGEVAARSVALSLAESRMTREASERLFAEARELMPGGVSSPVQAFRAVGGGPVFVERGEGAYLVDVDGGRYVDYVLSWGPLVLGHAHPRVVAALEEVRRGTSYGAPSPLEVELARLIREAMPSIELVRFVNSGTEATMSALGSRVRSPSARGRQVHRLLPRSRGSPARPGGLRRGYARASGLPGVTRARSRTR